MSNQPNDPKTETAADTHAPAAKPYESPAVHAEDLLPHDLKLTPGPRQPRHIIENQTNTPPTLILEPKPRKIHHTPRTAKKADKIEKTKQPLTTKQKVLRVLLIVALVLVAILLIATGTFFVMRHLGKNELLDTDDMVLSAPQQLLDDDAVKITDNGRTVVYNGETYVFNEDRANILCIGTDKETLGNENGVVGTGGQADAIFILSFDTKTGDLDALAIPRDTLADIDVYNTDGKFTGVEHTQICLSFAYGDGKESSCENTVKSVERLLYGIPVNTYFAIDLSAIEILNDAVGGVEVTLPADFKRDDGSIAKAGQTIVLQGTEAERFVRERDIEQLDSNLTRMERQKIFLSSFFKTALSATVKDPGVPLALLDQVPDNSVTNLNASRITYLASTLVAHHGPLEFASVKGEVVKGEDGYAEYIHDEVALYEQILSIFYNKA